ncbi:MAG: outer membrane protein assembly factor BamD [Candidatus Methylacidiphilales bacterium]|nr:outer membrane protein assembly factor BamD [Candidatus Methylacidiphilales bacterium]
MRSISLALLLAFGFCLYVLPAQGALVWRPGEGWADEKGGDVSASSSKDQLELAKRLEAKGEIDDAYKAYKGLVRKWPLSFSAPEAQYKVAWIESKKGDFWKSFKSYQRMVEKYPNSSFFDQALEQEFMIGNMYLGGEPQKIMKVVPLPPQPEKTVEIFESVIKAAPYGKWAPQAQFKIGLAKEKQKKFPDAVRAYNELINKYPGHDIVDDAQYQIGYAWMMAASQPEYDQSAAQKAVESFQDFLVRYPNSEKVAQAEDNIKKLNSRQTEGSLNIAKFYESQKNLKAAYIYYNEVLKENPDGKQAEIAKKKIELLRPYAESQKALAATPRPALPVNSSTPSSVRTPANSGSSSTSTTPVASNNGAPSRPYTPGSMPPQDAGAHPETEALPR